MAYGSFQDAITRLTQKAAGVALDISYRDVLNLAVETAAGIAVGVVAGRGTIPGTQCVVGGDAVGVGITMLGDAFGPGGAGNDNVPIYNQNDQCSILRTGYIYANVTGTADAGSRVFSYTDATGAILLAAATTGTTTLNGVELQTSITTSGLALLKLSDCYAS